MAGVVKADPPTAQVKFAIEPKFDAAEDFSEGLARVKIGGKYGYISPPSIESLTKIESIEIQR